MTTIATNVEPRPGRTHRPPAAEPRAPEVFAGAWDEALDFAREQGEPIFVPITPFADERGWSIMNLFAGALDPEGQVNFSLQHPGVIKAWHRHRRQTDFWCCVSGHLKAGVHREEDGATWLQVLGDRRPGVLVIPETLWHGAAAIGAEAAALLYYVTRRYDPIEPDEERRPHDSIAGFPWALRHG